VQCGRFVERAAVHRGVVAVRLVLRALEITFLLGVLLMTEHERATPMAPLEGALELAVRWGRGVLGEDRAEPGGVAQQVRPEVGEVVVSGERALDLALGSVCQTGRKALLAPLEEA